MTADIDDRLRNWGRWVRVRRTQGRCMSIEGRYRIPRGAEVEWQTAAPLVSLPSIDALDAVEVERVMRFVPELHRQAMIYRYVWTVADRGWCCRQIGIHYGGWGWFLDVAGQMVANLLTKH